MQLTYAFASRLIGLLVHRTALPLPVTFVKTFHILGEKIERVGYCAARRYDGIGPNHISVENASFQMIIEAFHFSLMVHCIPPLILVTHYIRTRIDRFALALLLPVAL